MKRGITVIAVVMAVFGVASPLAKPAQAVSTNIVLSEVMTGHVESQSKEFVELYNNSSETVLLSGWTVEYKSAAGKTWSRRATLGEDDTLSARGYFVLSTELTGSKHISSGMAQSGGNLRLRDAAGTVIDQLAWGDGDSPEGEPVVAPALGQSLSRGLNAEATQLIDTDNNSSDFHASTSPTENTPPVDEEEDSTSDSVIVNTEQSANIIISELLPDPQSPLSDSKDEFIELYNQGDNAVQLEGWSLRDKTNHVFRIGRTEIVPRGFVVLKSATTKLSLNNDGDEISLIDPLGNEVDRSSDYGAVKAGMSWGVSDGGWAWLSEPTPGASNASALVIAAGASAEKKVSVKKSTTKKSAIKATKKPKKAKKPSNIAKAASAAPASYSPAEAAQNSRLWSWLLIALGIGTIGYGIYAYRPEITHIIHQLRTKFGNR